MTLAFSEISAGQGFSGVVAGGGVLAVEQHGPGSATYRTADVKLDERILTSADLDGVAKVTDRRCTLYADGPAFRLASEARRMKWAHLAVPFALGPDVELSLEIRAKNDAGYDVTQHIVPENATKLRANASEFCRAAMGRSTSGTEVIHGVRRQVEEA